MKDISPTEANMQDTLTVSLWEVYQSIDSLLWTEFCREFHRSCFCIADGFGHVKVELNEQQLKKYNLI